MPDPLEASQDRQMRGFGAVALMLGGLVAAFGVASCCGLPFMLATLGLGTACWVDLRWSPRRIGCCCWPRRRSASPAAVLLWRQRTAVCVPGAVCTRPAIRGATLVGLLIGIALLYLGYAYA